MEKKNILISEKGSSLVFLLIIMSGIISLTLVYVYAANRVVDYTYGNEVMFLAGRSILSEYDKDLWEEYGIFAFRGSEGDINGKLATYGEYSFANKRSLNLGDMNVALADYSLVNTRVFKREVIGHVSFLLARSLVDGEGFNSGTGNPVSEGSDIVLRNHKVIDYLPSGGIEGSSLWERIKNAFSALDKVFERGTDNFFINRYAMLTFKNGQNVNTGKPTLFDYEVEYIIEGKLSDKENMEEFLREVLLVRNAANLIFLYADPEKRGEIIAAAELIAPGPGGLVAQAVIAELWALAESKNDILLLEQGKKVPFYKSRETWATDLDSALLGSTEYIDTGSPTGFDYSDYLQIFLFFMDEDVKLSRMMDLIQINMQGNHDSSFRIREYNTGFSVNLSINGKEYSHSHSY